MNTSLIKQADENDLEEILHLQKSAFTEVAKQLNRYDIQPLLQTIEEIRTEFQQGVFLKYITTDNRIVGSVRGNHYEDQTCYINKLIVHPDIQNQGIGKELMYEIEKYFPVCRRFSLFTGEGTPNTKYLYQKLGYQETGKKEIGGISMLMMEKIIDRHG